MAEANSTTKKVLKALGVFGGVQGLGILAGVLRAKCAALWIGPAGVGIMTLFVQAVETLSALTQLNLRQSAVREISQAPSPESKRRVASVTRHLGLILGLAGAVVMLLMAPLFSRWAFGNGDMAWIFRLMSLVMLMTSATGADLAVLQGLSRLKALASASLWGSLAGTALLVAALWFWRMDGIPAALLALPFGAWIFARIYSRKTEKTDVSPVCEAAAPAPGRNLFSAGAWRAVLKEGRGMLALGVWLTISTLVAQLASYIFSIYLNREASTADVGLFQSGFTIINQYVGMIFTAISMEYFPRLSAEISRPRRASVLVSHEMSVALWVLMPVIVVFVCFDELMVRLLYSEAFLDIIPFIGIAIAGVIFRAASWCMAFMILARGDGRAFILTESCSAGLMLALYIGGWHVASFAGLGVAYVIWYAAYALLVWIVCRRRYALRLGRGMGRLLMLSAAVACGAVALRIFLGPIAAAALTLPWLLPLSYRHLRRRKK